MNIWEQSVLGNSVQRWIITFATALVVTIVLRTVLALVRNRVAGLAKTTNTVWDDVVVQALSRVRFSLVATALFCFAGSTLTLPSDVDKLLSKLTVLLLLIQAGISLANGFEHWLDHSRRQRMATDPGSVSSFGTLRFVGNTIIWSVIVMLSLDNLGVDVSTLVAGLGVSGIAVALAVQNVLGDLFASLTIVLDKPFIVGNFLKVGDHLGTVENIGLKTTRLRSLSGEQLIFSNNDLLQSRIQNYGRLDSRRVSFSLGVTYQTSPEHLELIPELIKEAIDNREKVRFSRAHFSGFGNFALLFETVYFVDDPDYAFFMDNQQRIYLHIARAFADRGIEFAYPTQTLFVKDDRPPSPTPLQA